MTYFGFFALSEDTHKRKKKVSTIRTEKMMTRKNLEKKKKKKKKNKPKKIKKKKKKKKDKEIYKPGFACVHYIVQS